MGGFRAKDADRERYVEVIETAYVDGQLGDQDRDLRVTRALTAETLDELDLLTRDLQNQPAPVVVHQAPAPKVVPPEPVQWPVPKGDGLPRNFLGFAAAGIVGLMILAMASSAQKEMEPLYGEDDYSTTIPWDQLDDEVPDPGFRMKARDVRELVGSYEAEFGSLETYQVSFFPRRVVVHVPVDGARPRFERWTWDGEWTKDADASPLAAPQATLDLGALDAERLVDNIETAKGSVRVERGRFDRAVMTRHDADVVLEIVVRNQFNESGSLVTTPEGDIVRRHPFQR